MKKYIFTAALASTLLATSCSDSEGIENVIPNDQKEKISFSLSDGSAQTRAGFKGQETLIAMRIQSDKRGGSASETKYTRTQAVAKIEASGKDFSEVTFNSDYVRYWDDAHGRYSLLSVYAVAIPNKSTDTEDKLSLQGATSWDTNSDNTIEWTVSKVQTKDATEENTSAVGSGTIDNEDLVYSNNIQEDANLGKNGVYRFKYTSANTGAYDPSESGGSGHYNGRMLFYQHGQNIDNPLASSVTDASGKFDKGHLVFNHALSRLTVTLEEGTGFDDVTTTNADFNFNSGNITLLDMPYKGKLDIKAGTWSSVSTDDITQMASTGTHYGANGSYVAQMLPDYTFTEGDNTNVMKFTIDNNTYFVTQDMIYNALKNNTSGVSYTGTSITMEQGRNYQFKITVNKKEIASITATLAAWTDVTAKDFEINNAHVTFNLRDNTSGDACTEGINFYRLKEDLGKIYTDDSYYTTDGKGITFTGDYATEGKATLSGTSPYSTNWYYDDNRTAYHFRTISNNATLQNAADPKNSYFTMTGANTMPDYHWGAPMKNGANLVYSFSEGYKENIHPGLTSTTSPLMITEMHMMSNIFITLETTTGSDKVVLTGATIKLTRLSNTATVDMGTGYITPGTVVDDVTMQSPASGDYWYKEGENVFTDKKTNAFKYAVIPQLLKRNSGANDDDYVGITITTSDHNQYYVIRKLSEIEIEKITQGGNAYTDPDDEDVNGYIVKWYPNHAYHYNIKITKKGIEAITCTVSKWVDVVGKDISIDLES